MQRRYGDRFRGSSSKEWEEYDAWTTRSSDKHCRGGRGDEGVYGTAWKAAIAKDNIATGSLLPDAGGRLPKKAECRVSSAHI